jgi:hypothetical protein
MKESKLLFIYSLNPTYFQNILFINFRNLIPPQVPALANLTIFYFVNTSLVQLSKTFSRNLRRLVRVRHGLNK